MDQTAPKGMDHFKYARYYFSTQNKLNLINHCKGREFAMLTMKGSPQSFVHRYLSLPSIGQFDSYVKCSGMKDKRLFYNFYRSVAIYNSSEPFTYIGDPKKRDYQDAWIARAGSNIIGYDFVLDIDAPDFEHFYLARDDTAGICQDLEERGAPFKVYYSGMGFHVVIQWEKIVLPPRFGPLQALPLFSSIARHYKDHFSDFVDASIYDDKRLIKIPGSLAAYPDQPEPFVTCQVPTRAALLIFNHHNRALSMVRKKYSPAEIDSRLESSAHPDTPWKPMYKPMEGGLFDIAKSYKGVIDYIDEDESFDPDFEESDDEEA